MPSAWLCCAIVLAATSVAADPQTAIAPQSFAGRERPDALAAGRSPDGSSRSKTDPVAPADLVVSRTDDSAGAEGVTLRRALELAADDPRDNLIRFDASAIRAGGGVIRLASPLVYGDSRPPVTREGVEEAVRPASTFAGGSRLSRAIRSGGCDVIDGGNGRITITGGPEVSAVLVVQRAKLTLRNMKIAACGDRGVVLSDCETVVLEGCEVGSRGVGITVLRGGRAEIYGGAVTDNVLHGIELRDESKLKLDGAILRGNGHAGLALSDGAMADVVDCRIESNGRWGVAASEDSRIRARKTHIREAGLANLDVRDRADVVLEECCVADGKWTGVILTGRARSMLARTSIVNHRSRGMELQDDAEAGLADCRVERSGELGAVTFDRARIRINGGGIRQNRGHGVVVRDRSAADIRDCAFEANEYSGISAPDMDEPGRLCVRRCVFRANGLRPIARSPACAYPPAPVVVGIDGDRITVEASPRAVVDLHADPVGEASRYLGTVTADDAGRFTLRISTVPPGLVITATATVDGRTSEFNVVAGRLERDILAALLARTGPFSDEGGNVSGLAPVRRWRPGTKLVYHFEQRPPVHVERVVREFIARVECLVSPMIHVQAVFGPQQALPADAVVVPIRQLPAADSSVRGTGGTTVTRWDGSGHLAGGAAILLAEPVGGEPVCPRVVIHEMCHALGLYHARAGLLSRMQGIPPPLNGYCNDFSPGLTFFDVAALRILYDRRVDGAMTIDRLTQAGLMPKPSGTNFARADSE